MPSERDHSRQCRDGQSRDVVSSEAALESRKKAADGKAIRCAKKEGKR
jgi:hypothetical protein